MEKAEKFADSIRLLEEDHILDPKDNSFKNLGWSFVGGCSAGVAAVLVGHPLDTVKVRMQMLNIPLFRCGKTMLLNEGISSFYLGIASPLYNIPLCYAISLGSYEMGRWALGLGFHEQMSFMQGAISGTWAGITSCIVLTPMELVKCKLQMEILPEGAKKTTAMAMTKKIIKSQGIRGLYRGNLICILREIPGCAVYFGAYEYIKGFITEKYNAPQFAPFMAGDIAGFVSWIVSYPQDAIKTRLQLDLGPIKKYESHKFWKDGGIISCTKDIWKTEGMKGFWRGFSACALRSVVSEAFSFFVYEKSKKFLTRRNHVM